jgi:hypothetical protein
MGFTHWMGGWSNVMMRLSPLKLTFNLNVSYCGSGHLPPQPYVKMIVFQLTGGVRSWFRQVVSGVELHGEPYVFHSVDHRSHGDIAEMVVGVGRCGKPHLPLVATLSLINIY